MRKANISFNTLLMILMLIIFVGLLVFGFTKIIFLKDKLSDSEILEYEKLLIKDYKECKEPLNKNKEILEIITNNKIDFICFFNHSFDISNLNGRISSEALSSFETAFQEGGDDVYFFKISKGSLENIKSVIILSSFNINYTGPTVCYVKNDRGEIPLKIICG